MQSHYFGSSSSMVEFRAETFLAFIVTIQPHICGTTVPACPYGNYYRPSLDSPADREEFPPGTVKENVILRPRFYLSSSYTHQHDKVAYRISPQFSHFPNKSLWFLF
jgi:hypothetical protein